MSASRLEAAARRFQQAAEAGLPGRQDSLALARIEGELRAQAQGQARLEQELARLTETVLDVLERPPATRHPPPAPRRGLGAGLLVMGLVLGLGCGVALGSFGLERAAAALRQTAADLMLLVNS